MLQKINFQPRLTWHGFTQWEFNIAPYIILGKLFDDYYVSVGWLCVALEIWLRNTDENN